MSRQSYNRPMSALTFGDYCLRERALETRPMHAPTNRTNGVNSSYPSHSFPFQISLKRMLQNPTQRMTVHIPQAMALRKTRSTFN